MKKNIFILGSKGYAKSYGYFETFVNNFIDNYECYEADMKKAKGIRPWEKGALDIEKDLNQSSGNVADKEGEER